MYNHPGFYTFMNFLKKTFKRQKTIKGADEMFTDKPLGIREWLLRDFYLQRPKMEPNEKLAFINEANRISDLLVERNLQGIKLERAGEIEKAIELYEQNIKDLYLGSHPYDRLSAIYIQRNQYEDGIRVCRAYLKMNESLFEELDEKFTDIGDKKYKKYKKTIKKLSKKKAKADDK